MNLDSIFAKIQSKINAKKRDKVKYNFITKNESTVIVIDPGVDFTDIISKHYIQNKKSRRESFYCKRF